MGLLLMLLACTVTTNIPEFQARLHEACEHPEAQEAVKNYSVVGTHKVLRVTLTLTETKTGQPMSGTPEALWHRNNARMVWKALYGFYRTERFEYVVRDGNDTPFCGFYFEGSPDQKLSPRRAMEERCLTSVNPTTGVKEWWQ